MTALQAIAAGIYLFGFFLSLLIIMKRCPIKDAASVAIYMIVALMWPLCAAFGVIEAAARRSGK